ncbi:sphingomyelinase C-like [Diadema antillarum]|uniref:sphingomyelinase C-like n=1 Tax=Diadema antillarum TaxID=105358 RepID=UPI003A8502B0
MRVLCSSPPAIPLSEPSPATQINIVAYNIWELRYLYQQNGQRERTCRQLKELFRLRQDIDVIVFNEAFMGGCFSSVNSTTSANTLTIRDILVQYGFNFFTRTIGEERELPKFENGGVFIATRWPIEAEDETIYNNAVNTTSDALSAKGAKYARVVKTVDGDSRIYHIFGTHLQASKGAVADNVRVKQASQMYDFAQGLNLPSNEPVIYAGDLNVNFYTDAPSNAADIFEALEAVVPPIIGVYNYTTDGLENDARDGNSKSFKDYVIYNQHHLNPTTATQEILRPRASESFEVCMEAFSPYPSYPHSPRCRKRQNITDLSDHFAVIGVLDFDDRMFSTTDQAPTSTDSEAGRLVQDLCMVLVVIAGVLLTLAPPLL